MVAGPYILTDAAMSPVETRPATAWAGDQAPSAQVTGTRGTIYGSEGWASEKADPPPGSCHGWDCVIMADEPVSGPPWQGRYAFDPRSIRALDTDQPPADLAGAE